MSSITFGLYFIKLDCDLMFILTCLGPFLEPASTLAMWTFSVLLKETLACLLWPRKGSNLRLPDYMSYSTRPCRSISFALTPDVKYLTLARNICSFYLTIKMISAKYLLHHPPDDERNYAWHMG